METGLLAKYLKKTIQFHQLLQSSGLQTELPHPRLVFIGSQRSGKSSLIQQIVGMSFLPTVPTHSTRRPIQIRFVHYPNLQEPYAQFHEFEGQKRFTNFEAVKQEIVNLTIKECGNHQSISSRSIKLKIYSSIIPDLEIIDLPGHQHHPTYSRDSTMINTSQTMMKHYMSEKNSIIVLLHSANYDIATSLSLKLAFTVDPQQERTIVCLNKIDLMDRGTDALSILKGEQFYFQNGCVGIYCKSNESPNILERIKHEKLFFSKHYIYSTLPPQFFGTENLVKKLQKMMTHKIESELNLVYEEIKKKKQIVKKQLQGLGISAKTEGIQSFAWKSVSDFMKFYKNSLLGVKNSELKGNPICSQIHEELQKIYQQQYQFTNELKLKDIERAINNFVGCTMPGFPSIDAFLAILTPLLRKLQSPLVSFINKIFTIMHEESNNIIECVMNEYPQFKVVYGELVKRIMEKYKKQLEKFLLLILQSQLNYLFTNDLNYLKNDFSMTEKEKKKFEGKREFNPLMLQLKKRVDSYYKLVVSNLRQLIPKQVQNLMIHQFIKQLEFQSLQLTSDPKKLKQFLSQSDEKMRQRKQCEDKLEELQKIQKIFLTDPEISKSIKDKKRQAKYYAKLGLKSPFEDKKTSLISEEKEKMLKEEEAKRAQKRRQQKIEQQKAKQKANKQERENTKVTQNTETSEEPLRGRRQQNFANLFGQMPRPRPDTSKESFNKLFGLDKK